MVAATVLIPTHNRVEPLRQAVASVQAQSIQDFELFIVGDGAVSETCTVAEELQRLDTRIRFFNLPKGPRRGELNRHEAVKSASGRFVAYIGDDDVCMSHHLATLDALLKDADFGHTMHVGVEPTGSCSPCPPILRTSISAAACSPSISTPST